MADVTVWLRDGTGQKLTDLSAAEAGRLVSQVLGDELDVVRLHGYGNGVHAEHHVADITRITVER